MYSPPPDHGGAQRMRDAFTRAAAALSAVPAGPGAGTWGWRGRTLSAAARHPEFGECWLRVVAAPGNEAGGKTWDGPRDAQTLFGASIRKPALYAVHDEIHDGWSYRAEMSELVRDPVLSAEPVLTSDPGLPATWWKSLRASLDTVAATATSRVAVRQEWIDRRVPEFTGAPAPKVTAWATAHGDLHPANVTNGTEPWILDWEGFGTAPAGYDAAMMHAYSLLVPGFAAQVRETFPILGTAAGRTAQLVVAAELLQSASRGDHPELVPAVRELAASSF